MKEVSNINLLQQNLFAFHNLKLQKHIIHTKWMIPLIFLVDDNQNWCDKFTNIFEMWAVDHERKIQYNWPKSNKTNIPKNYRPITCLSTMYNILTSIVTERTYNFLDANNILPSEQKVCKKRSYGCKAQLLINKMLLENSRSRHRNLSAAWIDYRKAHIHGY